MLTKTIRSNYSYLHANDLLVPIEMDGDSHPRIVALNEWRTASKDFHLRGGYGNAWLDEGENIHKGQRIRLIYKGNPHDPSVWEVELPIFVLNKELERFFNHSPYKLSKDGVEYTEGVFFNKHGTTLNGIWHYFDAIKRLTVKTIPEEQWKDVKESCDDLFCQASNGKYKICPAWILGGLGEKNER